MSANAPDQPDCACGAPAAGPGQPGLWRYLAWGLPLLLVWWLLYQNLAPLSRAITHDLLGLERGGHLAESLAYFLYDAPKVLMLLLLVVFGVGLVRSFFSPEKTRALLAGRHEAVGNVMAAGLGIVTPFCSCSAVPLFIGFVSAGVPLGVTFSFLISAPMVNEVAVVLLWGLFGWKVAAIYMATGLVVAVAAGWVIGRLNMERHLEDWVRQMQAMPSAVLEERLTPAGRVRHGLDAVRQIVGRVWPWVLAGVAVGSFIHGYAPQDFLASVMGRQAWWSVPLAVLIGIPMYANAAGIVPVAHANDG
ncbi:MAG: permease, partial [Desulfarculus sp.]|nr:permease [Desulfarculus sp.]